MKSEDKGHKKLEIYQLAHSLAVRAHKLTLSLPSFERYEEGSQLRRSSKSISANIVEGYALRRYKNEFMHYLFRAYGSAEESIEHLELLFETNSLTDEGLFKELHDGYNQLAGKLLRYLQAVDKEFDIPRFMKEPLSSILSISTPRSHL
jgi:four helix bundle protein